MFQDDFTVGIFISALYTSRQHKFEVVLWPYDAPSVNKTLIFVFWDVIAMFLLYFRFYCVSIKGHCSEQVSYIKQ